MKDFLYHNLPAIWHESKYIVFSPYKGELVELDKKEIENQKVAELLQKQSFFGKPLTERGSKKIIRLVLILTTQCQLACKYCYTNQPGHNPINTMLLKTAITAIKKAYQEKQKTADAIEVLFFGGEPTIEFGLIKQIVTFVNKLPLKIFFTINTNGMINSDILNYLIQKKIFIILSCDGPSKIQKFLRPTRNKIVWPIEKIIKKLVEKNALFCIRSTITKYNSSLSTLVDYFSGLGVKFLHFEKVIIAGRAKSNMASSSQNYIDEFSKALKLATKKKIYLITSSLMNLFNPADHFCVQMTGEKYIITPTGEIMCCYFEELKKICQIGMIRNDEFLLNDLQKNKLAKLPLPIDCTECAFKYFCSGGCPADNFLSTGTFTRVNHEICKINQAILHEAILFLYKNKSKFNPLFGTEELEIKRFNN